MCNLIFGISFLFSGFLIGQKPIYYLIGRPYSFAFNNALQEVADEYKLTFSYALGDVYSESMAAEIVDYQKHNDSIIAAICKNTPNCIDFIFEDANYEIKVQDSIRTVLYSREEYLCKSSFLNESYILFDKKSKKKAERYWIYLLGNKKSETERKIETIAIYSWKNGRIKPKKVKNYSIPKVFCAEGI